MDRRGDLPCVDRRDFSGDAGSPRAVPAGFLLAVGGLTYPMYLLHLQFGYVLFVRQAPSAAVLSVVSIVSGMILLAWAAWRFFEKPAQRWTKDFLTSHPIRLGWSIKPNAAVGNAADLAERSGAA
jgi:peptidoglycan/LPS O-acetylase OafA/YrhL